MGCQSIVLEGVIVSDELFVLVTDLGALSGGVAVGDTWEVDVGVDVGSHEVEDVLEAETGLLAALSAAIAAGVSVAGEELDGEGWDLEEGIEKGSSRNAAPILGDQSLEGRVPIRVFAPIPAYNRSGNAVIDWLIT